MDELTGGNSNQIRRDGQTVLREMGRWSPFVHALLKYLHAKGFHEAPQFIEIVGDKECLTYIAGDVGNDPLKPEMLTDTVIVDAATLLRRLHDATRDFVIPSDADFFLPNVSVTDYEVIGHNDFAPYNCVYRDGRIIGVIDFDTAAPTTRLWDIAYAVYRFVPLMPDEQCHDMGFVIPPNRIQRLKLFCDTYGLDDRRELIPTVIKRIEALIDYMRTNDFNPDHIPFYEVSLQYIRNHQAEFAAVV